MNLPKKKLGQHWLHDKQTLEAIAATAAITQADTVLEIGPGLGTLTEYLTHQALRVVAVEFDKDLADSLLGRAQANNLDVINEDILKFDLSTLPQDYKVVANIPYYLTSNLLRTLSESANPPKLMVILVQKEVAERICAKPGQMSLLSVSVQLYYTCELGIKVPAEMFTPPPKIDSQVVILRRHEASLFPELDTQKFFQIVKAGFAGRRKKLRSSLAGGMAKSKPEVDDWLKKAGLDGNLRAQNLSLSQWHQLYKNF